MAIGGLFALLWLRLAPSCVLLGSVALRRPALLGPSLLAALLAAALLPLSVSGPGLAVTDAVVATDVLRGGVAGLTLAIALASPLLATAWFAGAIGRSVGFADGGAALTRLYGALAVALFFSFGGHRTALELHAQGLQALPLTGSTTALSRQVPAFAGDVLTRALGLSLVWAAPFWLSMWLFDGLAALYGRLVRGAVAGPLLAPLRVAVGLGLLVAGGVFVVDVFPAALEGAYDGARRLLRP